MPRPARSKRAVREVGREESLADTADRARCEKSADALDDGLDRHAGASGDFAERVALEAFELVLGDSEDGGVDWVVEGEGYGNCDHDRTRLVSRNSRLRANLYPTQDPLHGGQAFAEKLVQRTNLVVAQDDVG